MIALPPPSRRRHPTREQWRVTRATRATAARDWLAARSFDQWLMTVCIGFAAAMLGRAIATVWS